jgi:CBS domain-containing protein
MQAKEIMSPNVETISPETPVRDAAQKMKGYDVGFLPVVEGNKLAGTLTDRDIAIRVVADGKDPAYCKTREVMTHDAVWCYDDQEADEVANTMAEKEIRRVMIVNRKQELVGVISIGDLAKVGGEQRKTGETIKTIAEAPPDKVA